MVAPKQHNSARVSVWNIKLLHIYFAFHGGKSNSDTCCSPADQTEADIWLSEGNLGRYLQQEAFLFTQPQRGRPLQQKTHLSRSVRVSDIIQFSGFHTFVLTGSQFRTGLSASIQGDDQTRIRVQEVERRRTLTVNQVLKGNVWNLQLEISEVLIKSFLYLKIKT